MANINKPFGLSPVKAGGSANWNSVVNQYVIPATDLVAYNIGDVVSSAAGADANGVPYVVKTAANGVARGVIVGIDPVVGGVSLVGSVIDLTNAGVPAAKAKDYYVFVLDDPTAMFAVQADAVTVANLVAANMNKNADFIVGAAPTAPVTYSGTVLSSASIATTATLPLKIVGLVQRDDNAFGAYAQVLVRFNKHELLGNTAGV